MTCTNCSNDAVFFVDPKVADAVYYCRACLPPNLLDQANAGSFPLPTAKPAALAKK